MRALLLSSALSLLISTSAFAQSPQSAPDDEILVTGEVSTFGATKSDIPILETSRSVSIITSDEFMDFGALTLDDTLNYTAGVIGDSFGFSTRGDFPYVRGLDIPEYLDNVQVLFGFYNNTRSDIYTLEQVEVLKGPASVLYGSGSPGGILNTVSKKAGPDALGREIVLDYGTHNRLQASADIGIDLSGDGTLTGRLVGVVRNSDTQIDFVNDDAYVFAPSITYDNGTTRLTALLNVTDRNSDTAHQFLPLTVTGCQSDNVEISSPTVCANAPTRNVDESLYVGDPNFNAVNTESVALTLFVEQYLTKNLTFEATARLRDASAEYRQSWVAFLGAGNPRLTTNGDVIGRSWYDAPAGSDQFAIDARLRGEFQTGIASHEVLAGMNYQNVNTFTNASYLYALPTTFNVFNPIYDGSEVPTQATFDAFRGAATNEIDFTGFYINDNISIGDFEITAGVRFDDVTTDDGTTKQKDTATSVSLGALYKTPFGLNPYINYSESFQPVVGNDNVTGESLKPQEGEQIEIGVKYKTPGLPIYLTAAYFELEQSNLPTPGGLPTSPSQQEGVAKIDGFELEARALFGDISLDGSVSKIDTKDPLGNRFESVPETLASLWAGWDPSNGPLEDFRFGAGVRHTGGNVSGFVSTDGTTLVDALVGYDVNESIALTLNARNLFDTEYYGTCLSRGDCFPGEARTVVGRLAYRF